MMALSPVLLCHVCSGTVGLLSGALTMSFRKGSSWHRAAGNVFFAAMLGMSATGAYIAYVKPVAISVVVGALTFYLVATAWWAARRRGGGTGMFDWGALLFALLVGAAGVALGFKAARSPAGTKDGYPAAAYFVFGSVALLCAVSDVRMLMRGGIVGAQRVARHLWRMCLALLIALLSLFPGQQHLFPHSLRKTNVLFAPHIVVIAAMAFWMFRVLLAKTDRQDDTIGKEVAGA